jgi:predicted transcriptional regulator
VQTSPKESILVFVKRRLNENKGILTRVSRDCDVPYSTLMKIAQGVVTNPRIGTVQKLSDYFAPPSA